MKKENRAIIYVTQEEADAINRWLAEEPVSEDTCLGEDEAITRTAAFGDGIEMDIKCCGVQYREGESNLAWTEAVLFDHGHEAGCTEPSDEFLGEWRIEYRGTEYVAEVRAT